MPFHLHSTCEVGAAVPCPLLVSEPRLRESKQLSRPRMHGEDLPSHPDLSPPHLSPPAVQTDTAFPRMRCCYPSASINCLHQPLTHGTPSPPAACCFCLRVVLVQDSARVALGGGALREPCDMDALLGDSGAECVINKVIPPLHFWAPVFIPGAP